MKKTAFVKGTGNVFADIGLPDSETHLIKAQLVHQIGELIKKEKLTQSDAAGRMAMTQPDVSKMLSGQFRPLSIERLMKCLVSLGRTITINVGPAPPREKLPRISVRTKCAAKRMRAG